jgi:uncharacterized lipoprotein YajG
MQFKKYLFLASLLFLAGCTDDNQTAQKEMQIRLDSMTNARVQSADSLLKLIDSHESQIKDLQAKNSMLADSLIQLHEVVDKREKSAPKPQMYPDGHGDSYQTPLKK